MPECPKCGSPSTKAAPAKMGEGFTIVRDRICDACGHQFRPPIPGWMPYMAAATGVLMIVGAIGLGAFFLFSSEPNKWRNLRGIVVVASVLIVAGGGLLATSWKLFHGDDNDNKLF